MGYKDRAKKQKYQREWVRRNRQEWIAANGPCIDCGTWNNLEVDHVDATSKVSHRIWSWSKPRREIELNKCVLRCTSCHQTKTRNSDEKAAGERNGSSVLTEDQVRQLRAYRAEGLSYSQLGVEFGVSKIAARLICIRKTWKHIDAVD